MFPLVLFYEHMTYPHGVYDFVKYVDSFYGTNDPLYPLIDNNTKDPLTLYDIMRATVNYVEKCLKGEMVIHWIASGSVIS